MDLKRTLFNVIKTDSDKTKIILTNVIKMLSNRVYLDDGVMKPLLNSDHAIENIDNRGDNTYVINTNNNESYAIKIVFSTISTTGKQSIISEFFRDYDSYKKIIVARDYINKIYKYVIKHNTQIFREESLLEDIISHADQPKFEILSPKEIEQLKSEYNVSDYTIKKMIRSDAIAKYLALRKGDVVRIIRPSPTSGEGIDYRIVI